MTSYCNSLLSEGQFVFYCPYTDKGCKPDCKQRWVYFLVRHVACLPSDDQQAFEKKIMENYANKAVGVQKCPGCFNLCRRIGAVNNRVICAICSKIKERQYEFCWSCLGEWKGSGTTACGNGQCDGGDGRLRILEICVTKIMPNSRQECPKIRCCPKCGMLIEHKDKCKHMDCTSCKHSFCFVCLRGKKADGKNWECGSYSGTCALAPRQTSIPGSQ